MLTCDTFSLPGWIVVVWGVVVVVGASVVDEVVSSGATVVTLASGGSKIPPDGDVPTRACSS